MFTHASWAADRTESYERLEFLGDSVLELAIARTLYDRFPDADEGHLAKLRSQVRSRAELRGDRGRARARRAPARAASRPRRAEEAESLSGNTKVQAAVVEAALGALFLERGLEAIAPAIVEAFGAQIEYALTESFDAKTELMELLGKEGKVATYRVLESEGPPHNRTFICAVLIDGEQAGTGRAARRRRAPSRRPPAKRSPASTAPSPRGASRRPSFPLASGLRASEGNKAARLQVVRGPGRGAPRAGRRGRHRAERVREIECLRLDPVGDRLAQSARTAGREARRRPLRRLVGSQAGRFLRGRARLRQRGRRLARPSVQRGIAGAAAPPRRRGPVPREPSRGAPDRSSSSCSPMSALGAVCARSFHREASSRYSGPSPPSGASWSRPPPGSAGSSSAVTAPS